MTNSVVRRQRTGSILVRPLEGGQFSNLMLLSILENCPLFSFSLKMEKRPQKQKRASGNKQRPCC